MRFHRLLHRGAAVYAFSRLAAGGPFAGCRQRMTRFSSPLPREEITFPELLREQAGYYTGVCGRSYHLDGSGARGGAAVSDLLDKHGLRTFARRLDYAKQGSDSQAVAQMKNSSMVDRRTDRSACG